MDGRFRIHSGQPMRKMPEASKRLMGRMTHVLGDRARDRRRERGEREERERRARGERKRTRAKEREIEKLAAMRDNVLVDRRE
jgi:hypothetical protein